jgi:hypothetical protein
MTPIIHVGLAKSGTTTLQHHFFATHPDIAYIGAPYADAATEAAVRDIALLADSAFDLQAVRQTLEAALDAQAEGKVPVISHEVLAGITAQPQAVVAKRLRAVFGAARIVITVREQKSLLRSRYLYAQKPGHAQPFENWWAEIAPAYLPLLQFDALAATYEAALGEGRVGVFHFEEMVHAPDRFAARLADFIGVEAPPPGSLSRKENPGRGARHLAYARLRRWVFPNRSLSGLVPKPVRDRFRRFVFGGAPPRFVLSQELEAKLRAAVAHDNRRLANRTKAPMDEYGYLGVGEA